MATLLPVQQTFLDLRTGTQVFITKVKLLSASDTVTLPLPSNTTNGASVSQVRDTGEAGVTLSHAATTGVVTITAGTVGQTVTLCSLHPHINSSTT